MAKYKSKTASLSLAGMMCFARLSTVSAQTTGAAKEPTPDQARDFITSMIEQHSSSSCEIKSDDPGYAKSHYDTAANSWLVKIDGNRVIMQWTSKQTMEFTIHKSKRTTVLTAVRAYSGPINELKADVKTVSYHHLPHDCGIPQVLELSCTVAGGCIKRKSTLTLTGVNQIGERISDEPTIESDSTSSVSIPIADASIAARVLKAVKFYQEHSPAAAPSPF